MDFFKTYFIDILKYKYADFNGRARRKEYWMFLVCYMLLIFGLAIVGGIISALTSSLYVMFIFMGIMVLLALGILVPSIALAVRRLHDTGKSGLFYLLIFVPFGSIILIVFYIMEGDYGDNEYGPDPKQIDGEY